LSQFPTVFPLLIHFYRCKVEGQILRVVYRVFIVPSKKEKNLP